MLVIGVGTDCVWGLRLRRKARLSDSKFFNFGFKGVFIVKTFKKQRVSELCKIGRMD